MEVGTSTHCYGLGAISRADRTRRTRGESHYVSEGSLRFGNWADMFVFTHGLFIDLEVWLGLA